MMNNFRIDDGGRRRAPHGPPRGDEEGVNFIQEGDTDADEAPAQGVNMLMNGNAGSPTEEACQSKKKKNNGKLKKHQHAEQKSYAQAAKGLKEPTSTDPPPSCLHCG